MNTPYLQHFTVGYHIIQVTMANSQRKKKLQRNSLNSQARHLVKKMVKNMSHSNKSTQLEKGKIAPSVPPPKTIVTNVDLSNPSEVSLDSDLSKKISELQESCKRKDEEIERLKSAKKVKRPRKKRKFTQLDWQVRNIAKNRIFRKVKFISSEAELESFEDPNSIGHFFFECLMEHVDDSTNIGDRKVFWETAKHSIYEAICEKRNAVQTAIKKKWIGKIFIHVFFIEFVHTHVRFTN